MFRHSFDIVMSQIDIPNAKTSFFIFQADLLNFWNHVNIHLEIRFSKHSWVGLFEFWDWGYFILFFLKSDLGFFRQWILLNWSSSFFLSLAMGCCLYCLCSVILESSCYYLLALPWVCIVWWLTRIGRLHKQILWLLFSSRI